VDTYDVPTSYIIGIARSVGYAAKTGRLLWTCVFCRTVAGKNSPSGAVLSDKETLGSGYLPQPPKLLAGSRAGGVEAW